jgi:hypothetical protein
MFVAPLQLTHGMYAVLFQVKLRCCVFVLGHQCFCVDLGEHTMEDLAKGIAPHMNMLLRNQVMEDGKLVAVADGSLVE